MYRFCNPVYEACYNEVCEANLSAKRKIDHKIVLGTFKLLFRHCREDISDYAFEGWNCLPLGRYEKLVNDLAHVKMYQLKDARNNVLEWLKKEIISADRAYKEG